MLLADYLDIHSINLNLSGTSKEQILTELVDFLITRKIVKGREPLLRALLEREGLGSTGIGFGVAIPHGRSPEISKPAMVFGRSKDPVNFDAIDGQPSRFFFLLVAPENGNNDHLYLLAKIARMMKEAKSRERLLEITSPEEAVAFFSEMDPA